MAQMISNPFDLLRSLKSTAKRMNLYTGVYIVTGILLIILLMNYNVASITE